MNNFTAKKSLGQHFLHAPNVVGAMIHAARIEPGMIVLEIGPGKGILTHGLLKAGAKVIAVEKDERAIEYMKEGFVKEISLGKLKLVQDDILTINPSDLGLEKGNYIIVANIPYYITGEILRKFLTAQDRPSRMVLLVQKELAKRIVAADKKESILSISVKAYGEPKYIDTVPKRFFRPIPKVDSAIILIDRINKSFFEDNSVIPASRSEAKTQVIEHNSGQATILLNRPGTIPLNRLLGGDDKKNNGRLDESDQIDEKEFFGIVKAGFAHKRKVVRGNLAKIIPAQTLQKLWKEKNWPSDARAENFTLEQWKEIAKEI